MSKPLLDRTSKHLSAAGISMRDSVFFTDNELRDIPGVGDASIAAIREVYPIDVPNCPIIITNRSTAPASMMKITKSFETLNDARKYVRDNNLQLLVTMGRFTPL